MEEKEKRGENLNFASFKVTRRGFLKGIGTGAISTAVTGIPVLVPSEAEGARIVKGVREAMVRLNVNGVDYRLKVKSHWTLLDVLRKKLGFTGTKKFCDRGSCGACTVIMEGKAIYACSRLAIEADNKKIVTVEGLADGENPHPIQQAFMENDGFQCGYCTPGFIMATKAILDKNPHPDEAEIKEGLAGNICRCSAYPKIIQSVLALAKR